MIDRLAIALAGVEDMSERLTKVAELTAGNIVEIGGGEGVNTIRFLRVAISLKAGVIVVDPFEQISGSDESYFKPYSFVKFIETVKYLADFLHIIRLPSQHKDVESRLVAFKPIGFMFIDGLQDTESVLSDLRLAESLDSEIICVDDYNRLTRTSQVPLAVTKFLETTKYKFIDIGKREAYFIK